MGDAAGVALFFLEGEAFAVTRDGRADVDSAGLGPPIYV